MVKAKEGTCFIWSSAVNATQYHLCRIEPIAGSFHKRYFQVCDGKRKQGIRFSFAKDEDRWRIPSRLRPCSRCFPPSDSDGA